MKWKRCNRHAGATISVHWQDIFLLDVFSLRVAFAVAALTLLVLFYLVTFRSTKSEYSAWWCLAVVAFLLGSSAYLLNGTWHQRWANPAGNAVLVLGAGCVWGAVRSLRLKKVKRWQLAAAPIVTATMSALDHPSTNNWSGGPYFLMSMSLMIGLASWELWRRRSVYHGAELPMAVTSGVVALFYLFRCGAFILGGADGAIFRTYFGSAATTLLTITLLIVVSFSIAALSAEQVTQALRVRASHDGLTGLLNRAAFLGLLEDKLGGRRGAESFGSLVMADLDHFKAVNDRSGHAAGDAALNAFASACRNSVRSNDLVGRYGGEEFILYLPGATPEQAARVTEQISLTMKDSDPALLLPTVSYGIAAVNAAGDALKAAIASADAALYQAKAQGRNQVFLATTLAL
ncbi:diguanylate cyclase (GGDEF)-like protein [Arthrobacter sp. V4I6]|uniref:GGDEF domain-containing protein n=1 Tax=unclassified Arthrobacter TaxID=235627 RepID=UPI002784CDCD|nr:MULTISPECIES: GGDEF domain-containing protein [unclassified Arthrobacter]MDQ0820987.1 diguanylate cyclase (GGDEF)-like protein [Arthrobacter sp. V1I7]MDQ0855248.1 diguanylate cyclase (GGDEF)-like protein [Arthrobacter sp. V4I6]